MVTEEGVDSLGARQRSLNERVAAAASARAPFEQAARQPERSDVDRLFKIDLAAEYRQVPYLMQTLHSADPLYVSRVINKRWLYEHQYSHVINPDHLHNNVFPSMPDKLQRKFLTKISAHVRDETRSQLFYEYCMRVDLPHYAHKFLLFTSLRYKTDYLNNNFDTLQKLCRSSSYRSAYFGENTDLIEIYLKKADSDYKVLFKFNYLCMRHSDWFFDLLESCYKSRKLVYQSSWNKPDVKFGLIMSKYIMSKYKDRVINNIELYVHLLQPNVLSRYTTAKEAKVIIIQLLLPNDSIDFWRWNKFLLDRVPDEEKFAFIRKIFKEKYSKDITLFPEFYHHESCYYKLMNETELQALVLKLAENPTIYANIFFTDKSVEQFWVEVETHLQNFVINNIQENRKFQFLKQVFLSKYPTEEFEFSQGFYQKRCYKIMTTKEKESWAMWHLANPDNDPEFTWRQFVNFNNAFERIAKGERLFTFIKTLNIQEQLLSYYNERHVNEDAGKVFYFIDKISKHFAVWDFNPTCWENMSKILHRLDIFNVEVFLSKHKENNEISEKLYKWQFLTFLWHIVHKVEFPKGLPVIDSVFNSEFYWLLVNAGFRSMEDSGKRDNPPVYEYFYQLILRRLEQKMSDTPCDANLEFETDDYLISFIDLQRHFGKAGEFPRIVRRHMMLDTKYNHHLVFGHIIHRQTVPIELQKTANGFSENIEFYNFEQYVKDITDPVKIELIYEYFYQLVVRRIEEEINNVPYNEKVQVKARVFLNFFRKLQKVFDKPSDEYPELILKYLKLDQVKYGFLFNNVVPRRGPLNDKSLVKLLKTDSSLIISKIDLLQKQVEKRKLESGNLKKRPKKSKKDTPFVIILKLKQQFLRKLRVYFSNDLAKEFINYFLCVLNENTPRSCLLQAIFAIINLSDVNSRSELLLKYAPQEPTLDRHECTSNNLWITVVQEAICRYLGYTRPAASTEEVLLYIKGDYTHFCLLMFSSHVSNITSEKKIGFIEALLDSPVSIKKHGTRLAFKHYPQDQFISVVTSIWKRSKNVTIRTLVFKYLSLITESEKGPKQKQYFELLMNFIAELNEDDDVWEMLWIHTDFPKHLLKEYIETVWKIHDKFPKKSNFDTYIAIVNNVQIVDKEIIEDIISGFEQRFFENKIFDYGVDYQVLTAYVVQVNNEVTLELLKNHTRRCLTLWTKDEFYRDCYFKLIEDIVSFHRERHEKDLTAMDAVFLTLRDDLRNFLPLHVANVIWFYLSMVVLTNTIIDGYRKSDFKTKLDLDGLSKSFASKLVLLINDMKDNKIYSLLLLKYFSGIVKDSVQEIVRETKKHGNNKSDDDFSSVTAVELCNSEQIECIALAIKISSQKGDYPYGLILEQVIKCDNLDLHVILNKEFLRTRNGKPKIENWKKRITEPEHI